jgi:hypothetical protein
LGFVVVSTHVPPQSVGGVVHPVVQANVDPEGAQTGALEVHGVLHPPQVAGLERSVSQPGAVLSQSAKPGKHVKPHFVPSHVVVAFGRSAAHGAPHDEPHVRTESLGTHVSPHGW